MQYTAPYTHEFEQLVGSPQGTMEFPAFLDFAQTMGWPATIYNPETVKSWFTESGFDSSSMETVSMDTMKAVFDKRTEDELKAANIRRRFSKLDNDGDGTLTREEIAKYYKDMGRVVSDRQLDQYFRGKDENEDGTISIEEFVQSQIKKR